MDNYSLGALIGCITGIIGGVVGAYYGVKGARTPQQKALAIKVSIISGLAIIVVLVSTLVYQRLAFGASVYVPEKIDTVAMSCFTEAEPIPWSYCIHKERGSNSRDVLYYFHARKGNETWWNDSNYHSGKLYKVWREEGVPAPTVVSISFGALWVLTETDDDGHGGLYTLFTQQVIPVIEKKLAAYDGKRMLAGISMGGYNSLIVAMKNKYFFHKAAALCAPLYAGSHHDGPWATLKKYFDSDIHWQRALMLWGFSKQAYPRKSDWQNNDPLALSSRFDPAGAPELYISCGKKDDWGCLQGTHILVKQIRKNHGNVNFVARPGGHCDIDHRSLALFLQSGSSH